MSIAQKIENFISKSSWIRKMFEDGIRLKARYGAENVFDFSLGNPNFNPPLKFKEALRKVANEDKEQMHGYMPNAGYVETRKAVASNLFKEHQIEISLDSIVMTCGAGGALNVIFKALLNPQDEVIVLTPFFVEYKFYIDNSDGVIKLVETNKDFSLNIENIAKSINSKTKAVLINSPNNPTGRVYGKEEIKSLSELLLQKSKEFQNPIYLISDEPYKTIVYDDTKVPSVFKSYKNSIIATSYSKTISIPGERIGYIAINPEIAEFDKIAGAMTFCNRILGFVNAPSLMQRVITEASDALIDVSGYKKKRDMLCDGLLKIGYKFVIPKGAFYLFPQTPIKDDIKFAAILQDEKILTVPGSGFGAAGHIRIAFCVDDKTILNSFEGFKRAFDVCQSL